MSVRSTRWLTGIDIDTWHVLAPLGSGHSGEVYRVRETVPPFRPAALKMASPISGELLSLKRRPRSVASTWARPTSAVPISGELLSLNGGRGRPPLQVSHTAFLREADLVAAQPIPGYMPRLFARGSFEGAPYFVMELAERLPDNLSAQHVIALTDRLTDALDRLWSAGLLHNDIKPQNLGLIGGQLVLLDFGSACKADEAAACRQRIGTPYYTAPEVNAGGHLSLVSNLYSLGMTLDELCTDEIRPVFTPLIRHATALNPADRPQTPAAFRAKLHRALPAYRKAAARTTRLDRFKTVAKWTAAVALGFVAIVWVIYAVQQQRVTRHGKSIIEQENNYIAALNFYRKGDFTNAVFLLRPIAEGDGSRKAQAQQLLKACLIPCSAESAAN